MKIYVKSTTSSIEEELFYGENAQSLIQGMNNSEKRIIARMKKSDDPASYMKALYDMVVILGLDVSDSFDSWLSLIYTIGG